MGSVLDSGLSGPGSSLAGVVVSCPWERLLTLSLPESNLESITVVVTFKGVDETLVCDHSTESYWAVLSNGTVCFWQFWKVKFDIFFSVFNLALLWLKGLISFTLMLSLSTQEYKWALANCSGNIKTWPVPGSLSLPCRSFASCCYLEQAKLTWQNAGG